MPLQAAQRPHRLNRLRRLLQGLAIATRILRLWRLLGSWPRSIAGCALRHLCRSQYRLLGLNLRPLALRMLQARLHHRLPGGRGRRATHQCWKRLQPTRPTQLCLALHRQQFHLLSSRLCRAMTRRPSTSRILCALALALRRARLDHGRSIWSASPRHHPNCEALVRPQLLTTRERRQRSNTSNGSFFFALEFQPQAQHPIMPFHSRCISLRIWNSFDTGICLTQGWDTGNVQSQSVPGKGSVLHMRF